MYTVQEQTLTCRCETLEGLPKLVVNFDPALVVVLREVRYFLGMRNPSIDIPAVGLKVRSPPCLPSWCTTGAPTAFLDTQVPCRHRRFCRCLARPSRHPNHHHWPNCMARRLLVRSLGSSCDINGLNAIVVWAAARQVRGAKDTDWQP